jgi:hypothetical protein
MQVPLLSRRFRIDSFRRKHKQEEIGILDTADDLGLPTRPALYRRLIQPHFVPGLLQFIRNSSNFMAVSPRITDEDVTHARLRW